MSGAKKHMERSHRSHRQKEAMIVRHAQKTLIKQEQHQTRKNFFQRVASLLHRKTA